MEKSFEKELEELLEKRENKKEPFKKLDENEKIYWEKQLEKQERISKKEFQEVEYQYEIMAGSATSAELARLNGVKKEVISELEKKHKKEKEKIEKKLAGKEVDTSDIDKEIQEKLEKEMEKLENNNKKLQMYLEQYKDHEKSKERIEEQMQKNDELLEKIKRIMKLKFHDLETSKIREIIKNKEEVEEKNKEKKQKEKTKIELSTSGLTIDGKLQDLEKNNKWYKDFSEKNKLELEFIKNDLKNFSNTQLNIFKALLKKDIEKNRDYFTIIDKLNSVFGYSDDSKGKNNIDISIDFTQTSILDRILGRCKLSFREVKEMKDMAYEMRDHAKIIKAGTLTKLGFKVREIFDKSKQKLLLSSDRKKQEEKKKDFKESIKVREEENFELKLDYKEKATSNSKNTQTSQMQENETEKTR